MRPTKEIITPITKSKILIKEWLTGREQEMLTVPKGIKGKMTPAGTLDMGETDMGDLYMAQRHAVVDAWVLSINDSTENVTDKVLDLPDADYEFILDEVKKVTDEYKKKAVA